MTKYDIVRKVQVLTGISHAEAELMMDSIIVVIKKSMREGHTIHLRGFGKFKPIERKQKVGQNMNTGQSVIIPAKKVVKFFPSKKYFKL